jgi:hypothetical protein
LQPDLILFKKGSTSALNESNYIPYLGEPIARVNSNGTVDKLKIGDGVHKYVDLPFLGESELKTGGLEQYSNKGAFPDPGNELVLYIALDTKEMWFWDNTARSYKQPQDLVGVPEAPYTGKKYARTNNTWSQIHELNIKGDIFTATVDTEEYENDYDFEDMTTAVLFKDLTQKTIISTTVAFINTDPAEPAFVELYEKSYKLYSFELEPYALQKYAIDVTSNTSAKVQGKVKMIVVFKVQTILVTEVEQL